MPLYKNVYLYIGHLKNVMKLTSQERIIQQSSLLSYFTQHRRQWPHSFQYKLN